MGLQRAAVGGSCGGSIAAPGGARRCIAAAGEEPWGEPFIIVATLLSGPTGWPGAGQGGTVRGPTQAAPAWRNARAAEDRQLVEDGDSPHGRHVRVAVIGEDPLARSGLAGLLAARSDLEVTGALSPGELADADPELAVVDAVAWDLDGSASTAEVLQRVAERGVRILALVSDPDRARDALRAGARGAIDRASESDVLAAALAAVAAGLLVLDEHAAEPLRHLPVAAAPLLEPLTPRELEVLDLLAQGLSNRAIADRLGISEHTAKFHVNAILGKLGAENRSEAIVRALRAGLVVI